MYTPFTFIHIDALTLSLSHGARELLLYNPSHSIIWRWNWQELPRPAGEG